MKGRMKKTFTALLAATVLVGGMPVNMQANVIAETEKSPSGIIPVRAFDIVCLVKYEMIRNQLLCRSSST